MKRQPGVIFAPVNGAGSLIWVCKHLNTLLRARAHTPLHLSGSSLQTFWEGQTSGSAQNLWLAVFDAAVCLKWKWKCVNTLQKFGRIERRDSWGKEERRRALKSDDVHVLLVYAVLSGVLVVWLQIAVFIGRCPAICTLVSEINIWTYHSRGGIKYACVYCPNLPEISLPLVRLTLYFSNSANLWETFFSSGPRHTFRLQDEWRLNHVARQNSGILFSHKNIWSFWLHDCVTVELNESTGGLAPLALWVIVHNGNTVKRPPAPHWLRCLEVITHRALWISLLDLLLLPQQTTTQMSAPPFFA